MPSLIIVAQTGPDYFPWSRGRGQTPLPCLVPLRIQSRDIIDFSTPGWWKEHIATDVTIEELDSLPMQIVAKVMDHLEILVTTASGKTGQPIKSDYLRSIHANWGKWFVESGKGFAPSVPDEDPVSDEQSHASRAVLPSVATPTIPAKGLGGTAASPSSNAGPELLFHSSDEGEEDPYYLLYKGGGYHIKKKCPPVPPLYKGDGYYIKEKCPQGPRFQERYRVVDVLPPPSGSSVGPR
jgi:hypothetical protein